MSVVVVPNPDLRMLLAARAGGHRFVAGGAGAASGTGEAGGAGSARAARFAVVERSGWLVAGDAALADDGRPVPTGALPHHAAVVAGLLRRLDGGAPGAWYALDLDGQRLRGGHGAPDLG